MKMKVVVSALSMALVFSVSGALPAQAATSCPTDKICVWTEPGFEGDRFEYDASAAISYNLHVPGDSHNARSWSNNSGRGGVPGAAWCLVNKVEQAAPIMLDRLESGNENGAVSEPIAQAADAIVKTGNPILGCP